MKLYLAGPMSGLPDFNYPAFHAAAADLRAKGHDVFNPAETFGGDQSRAHEEYLRVDTVAICEADAVAFLPGWDRSKGAVYERRVADATGRGVYLYDADAPDGLAPFRTGASTADRPHVALVGYAGAGKDSVADVLCQEFGYARVAFADPLREMAAALNPWIATGGLPGRGDDGLVRYTDAISHFGYTEAKRRYSEVRTFLQRLGTEAGRKVLGSNVWVDAAVKRARLSAAPVAFTDCRFPNEAAAVREMGGLVWRVDRPGVGPANDHASERFPAECAPDAVVTNDGTLADLAARVRALLP